MADIRQTAVNPSKDFIRATPRNSVLGYLSDLAASTYSPQRTQQMQGIARLFSAPAISQTLDRLAFGEPLTAGAGGIGGTTRVRPEVLEAGLALTDVLPTSAAAKLTAIAAPAIGGMFIGRGAKTWNALAAAKAKELEAAKVDPKIIWQQTGTWKGPDGKWRQEIPDNAPKITDDVFYGIKANQRFTGPIRQALPHEDLFRAYPDTGDISSGFYAWSKPEGTYDKFTDSITAGGPGTTSQKSAAVHELQHAIQQREGFARGGSSQEFISDIEALSSLNRIGFSEMDDFQKIMLADLRKKYGSIKTPQQAYQNLAGEAEARATQARMNMTSEQRRATFPEESYDVPLNELIIRGVSD
jgi:hypothetical protein